MRKNLSQEEEKEEKEKDHKEYKRSFTWKNTLVEPTGWVDKKHQTKECSIRF